MLGNVCTFSGLAYVVLQTYRVNSDAALRLNLLFLNPPTGICYLPSLSLFPFQIESQLRSYLPAGSLKQVSMSVGWCSLGGVPHVLCRSTLGQTFAQLTHTLPTTSRVTSHISLKYTLVFKIDSYFLETMTILTSFPE